MIKKKTKIIVTIGPASEANKILEEMIKAGADIFRFNTKHNTIDWHNKTIKKAQKAADVLKKKISILIDLQGPEIRIETRNQKEIMAKKGSLFFIDSNFDYEDTLLVISNKAAFESLKVKNTLLIDDGFIELKIIEKKKNRFLVKVIEGGVIKNKKSLNLPEKKLSLPSLVENDLKSLDMFAKSKIDFVALSFVRNKEDVKSLKKEMEKRKIKASIISKVENREALLNIDEIIDHSDAIMVARGDLGIEVPIEEIAYWQKSIILKCRQKRKPVIVATQMLHSMVDNPRPTRAEATDIANAVFNSTDAVMLSEETSIGNYPVKTVSTMTKILEFNEEKNVFEKISLKTRNSTELIVSAAASLLEKKIDFSAIVIFTESGYTATTFSSFRTDIKTIAVTDNLKTAEILSLPFGIIPYYVSFSLGSNKAEKVVFEKLKKEGLIRENERILVISGKHKRRTDLINSLSILKI